MGVKRPAGRTDNPSSHVLIVLKSGSGQLETLSRTGLACVVIAVPLECEKTVNEQLRVGTHL